MYHDVRPRSVQFRPAPSGDTAWSALSSDREDRQQNKTMDTSKRTAENSVRSRATSHRWPRDSADFRLRQGGLQRDRQAPRVRRRSRCSTAFEEAPLGV